MTDGQQLLALSQALGRVEGILEGLREDMRDQSAEAQSTRRAMAERVGKLELAAVATATDMASVKADIAAMKPSIASFLDLRNRGVWAAGLVAALAGIAAFVGFDRLIMLIGRLLGK
jgi:hypothetical protein